MVGHRRGKTWGRGIPLPSPDSSAIIWSSVDIPDKNSSSLSIPAVLVVVVWGVGGAAVMECLAAGAGGTEGGAALLVEVWATEASFLLGAGWSSGAVDASAAFRFLGRGGMVAVFG